MLLEHSVPSTEHDTVPRTENESGLEQQAENQNTLRKFGRKILETVGVDGLINTGLDSVRTARDLVMSKGVEGSFRVRDVIDEGRERIKDRPRLKLLLGVTAVAGYVGYNYLVRGNRDPSGILGAGAQDMLQFLGKDPTDVDSDDSTTRLGNFISGNFL